MQYKLIVVLNADDTQTLHLTAELFLQEMSLHFCLKNKKQKKKPFSIAIPKAVGFLFLHWEQYVCQI